jgi:hypothetical protein
MAKFRLTSSRNLKRGYDETSSLKPSSRDKRFRLRTPELKGIFKLTLQGLKTDGKTLFDLAKPSKKSNAAVNGFLLLSRDLIIKI